jgi:hypothetical protein
MQSTSILLKMKKMNDERAEVWQATGADGPNMAQSKALWWVGWRSSDSSSQVLQYQIKTDTKM